MPASQNLIPVLSLLTGAIVWGLIWYPYRALESAGLSGIAAALVTYFVALSVGLVTLRRHWLGARPSGVLVAIALAAGGCNLGYVLATLDGVVVRVLLLFYLAPFWTVVFARLLLNERVNATGALVLILSLAGAAVMLWQPSLGAPFPATGAEWIAVGAGLLFALTNVLVRKTRELTIELKSLAVFAGVIVVGLLALPLRGEPLLRADIAWAAVLPLVLLVGLILLVVNIVVQYGLMRIAANQAIVIFLFELVVAALSGWLLADERMTAKEWIGGAMIVSASLLSGRLGERN